MSNHKLAPIVYFDGTFLNNSTGIGRDAANLLSASKIAFGGRLEIVYPKFEITSGKVEFSRTPSSQLNRKLLAICVAFTKRPIKVFLPERSVYIQSHLFGILPLGKLVQSIVRLHDIFPVTNPDWFRVIPQRVFEISFESAIKSSFFVCDSLATKRDLLDLSPSSEERTLVSYCPVSIPERQSCQKCSLCLNFPTRSTKIVVTIGTLEPRKNYVALLQAWEKFTIDKDGSYSLIIIGKFGWKYRAINAHLKRSISAGTVLHFSDACDGSMVKMLESADFYISASLNEGFNLPAAEAALMQKKLLLSDIPVHRELYSDNALYFDPLEPHSISTALEAAQSHANFLGESHNVIQFRDRVMELADTLKTISELGRNKKNY
jgi:glycosyltransferase involved in cell wall biosynthesis